MIKVRTLDEKLSPSLEFQSKLNTQEYFINMGPQHPSTHGVLRLVLRLDGETVKEVIPVLGYIHRGIEKMAEFLNSRQIIPLTDRMDYLSAIMNNWAVTRSIEQLSEIETNDRIEVIRTLMSELQRIQSHQLLWGVFGMDLGAVTAFFYGFRDREEITDIIEETTGARLTMNYIQPGGLMYDLHPNFISRVKSFIKRFRPALNEYEDLLSGNIIFQERVKNVGILSKEKAIAYGATGPVLRASGVAFDLRKISPYGVYGKVDFDIPIGIHGDCWDRYWVRIEEMRQSLNIIEQLIDNIPEGPIFTTKVAKRISLKKRSVYTQLETARGILGVFIEGNGSEIPERVHFRSPNFNNLWAITQIAPGGKLADLVASLSSLDLVIPDIDR